MIHEQYTGFRRFLFIYHGMKMWKQVLLQIFFISFLHISTHAQGKCLYSHPAVSIPSKFTFPFLSAGHIFMSNMHEWMNKKMTVNFSDLSAWVFDVYLILLIYKSLHIFVIWINKSYQRVHFLYQNEKNPPTYQQLNLVEIFGYSIPHIGSEPETIFLRKIYVFDYYFSLWIAPP